MNRPTTLAGETARFFPTDYAAARARFRGLVPAASLTTFPLEGFAEPMATEAAWIGPASAQHVVVLVSGTHGVEGFAGAAIQHDFLARLGGEVVLPEKTAVLCIFALNPFGFVECRRCDEQGIDLNRNFVDFSKPLPANPGYEALSRSISAEAAERNRQFEAYRCAHGREAFEIAVSGGQYTDPTGPFFGGFGPAHGRRVIEEVIARFGLAQRRLAVVDIHSGLGPYGHGELINDHPLGSSGWAAARRWFGASVTSPAAGDSSSVRKEGLLDYCWHALMETQGCFVTLEFGSFGTEALFETILENHRCWMAGDAAARSRSAAAMKEHFCPADGYWRELVLVKARQVVQQALDGVCNG